MGVKPSADIKHAYLSTSSAAADFFHFYILFLVQAKQKEERIFLVFFCWNNYAHIQSLKIITASLSWELKTAASVPANNWSTLWTRCWLLSSDWSRSALNFSQSCACLLKLALQRKQLVLYYSLKSHFLSSSPAIITFYAILPVFLACYWAGSMHQIKQFSPF